MHSNATVAVIVVHNNRRNAELCSLATLYTSRPTISGLSANCRSLYSSIAMHVFSHYTQTISQSLSCPHDGTLRDRIARRIMPHNVRRILNLRRIPGSIDNVCQQNASQKYQNMATTEPDTMSAVDSDRDWFGHLHGMSCGPLNLLTSA